MSDNLEKLKQIREILIILQYNNLLEDDQKKLHQMKEQLIKSIDLAYVR